MKQDDVKNPKAGEELKTSTIIVLGIAFFGMLLMIYFASIMPANGTVFIIVGIVLVLLCVLLVSRNLKRFIIGKRREHLLKTGKLKEQPKKSYNPNRKFDDDE